ncbi:Bud site selection protein bud4 [Ceratobasidium sp. 423]|nr:Bud site selection protein bud4 [Ceratobasidium sp. 423]
MLDAGRASTIMTEAGNRPTSYMSTSSNASSKGEMTGRERIKAREEMVLQKRRELRAFDLEEQLVLDIPVDSGELTLEESFNTQLGSIYSGEVDNGKAWRTLRQPLDMNEYATEIQEIRVQPGSTKHGKVFVKAYVLHLHSPRGFILSRLPNVLEPNTMIDQEFEPIESGKLAFSPPIKIRKDSHIIN